MTFHFESDFQSHLQMLHSEKHQCDFCEKSFQSLREVDIHVKMNHDQHDVNDDDDEYEETDDDEEDNVVQEEAESIHMLTHETSLQELLDIDNFECSNCNENESEDEMKEQIKSFVETKIYHCDICGEISESLDDKESHMSKVHEIARSFFCDFCQGRFSKMETLLVHIKITHSKSLNFKCFSCQTEVNGKTHLEEYMTRFHEKSMSVTKNAKNETTDLETPTETEENEIPNVIYFDPSESN